ncbi:MAG TPA: hypothetical protein VIT23_12240, partial [Terrimicrobiaceae bacterium]
MATLGSSRGMPAKVSWQWVSLALVATIAVALSAFLGYRAFHNWRVERKINAAKVFLQEEETRKAIASLQSALILRPDHLEARSILASV